MMYVLNVKRGTLNIMAKTNMMTRLVVKSDRRLPTFDSSGTLISLKFTVGAFESPGLTLAFPCLPDASFFSCSGSYAVGSAFNNST